MASGAGDLTNVAIQVGAHRLRRRLLVFVKEDFAHAGKLRGPMRVATVTRVIVHLYLGRAGALQQSFLHITWELVPWRVRRGAKMLANRSKHLRIIVGMPKETSEDASCNRQMRVFDQGFCIHHTTHAEPIAIWTCTVRGIKGEVAWLKVSNRVPVNRAG